MNTNLLSNALKSVFGNGSVDNITSSSKVPYFDSNNNPTGLSTISNLASVLGGEMFSPNSDVDEQTLDNPTPVGVYRIGTSDSPFGIAGVIIKIKRNDTFSQLFLGTADNIMAYRNKSGSNAWGAWTRCDNFGCTTPSALASLLGAVYDEGNLAFSGNIDNVKRNMICRVDASQASGTLPGTFTDWFTLLTFASQGTCGFQIATRSIGTIKIRMLWDAVWDSWHTLTLT